MTQIIPYLHFDGRTREALNFYQQCLGGELVMQKVSESPMALKAPGEMGARILHGCLKQDKFTLMGSDLMGEKVFNGNSITLYINCSSEEEINGFFERLSQGGEVKEPLQQSFRGATFGAIVDKFGIHWMLNYSKN